MAIYVFSLLVGYELSGVDVAQGRRSEYLRKTNSKVKYMFIDLPEQDYIERYNKLGIRLEEMLSVHFKLCGTDNCSGNYSVKEKIFELTETLGVDQIVHRGKEITLYRKNSRIAVMMLKENPGYFYAISFFESERLIAREFYTDRLIYTNHYITAGENGSFYAKLKRTVFLDKEHRVVYECIYEQEGEKYLYPNGECLTKYELVERFIQQLNLDENDTIIIDRTSSMIYVQPLFQYKNKSRIMVFLHSGHYYKRGESDDGLFMNYEYYGWFKYSDKLDTVIVSTQDQKVDLVLKYKEYNCHIPRIEVIPVCGLPDLKYPNENRIPYSLITVSRINARKNIKWIIKSVIKAKRTLPGITLDIYGSGYDKYMDELFNYVEEKKAQSYIRFKGKVDVSEIYKLYEVYITASLWETLGLSCMEAVGSGNAMIGLNVRYGNPLFIQNDINGKLIDFNIENIGKENIEEDTVEKMTQAIVELFENKESLGRYQDNSYQIAKKFLDYEIEKKWLYLCNSSCPHQSLADLCGEYK